MVLWQSSLASDNTNGSHSASDDHKGFEECKETEDIDVTDVEKQYVSEEVLNDESLKRKRAAKSYRREPRPRKELTTKQKRCRMWTCGVFSFIILVTGVILLAKSLVKLDDNEYGLSYAKHSKVLEKAAKSGGMHTGPPGFDFIKFPSTFITEEVDGTCVSKDGLRVDFEVNFQYLIKEEHLYQVIIRYRNFHKWADIVEAAGRSAIHHSCSEYDISSFAHKRALIQGTMEDKLRLKLGGDPEDAADFGVYAEAISLQLRTVDLPDIYEAAVAEKQSAEENIELARNQRKQNLTTANTELLAAQQQGQRTLEIAANEAEVLLTEARLKANETIFNLEKEAETLASVKETLNLTTDGVLTYFASKMLETVSHLKVTGGELAKLSRKEELQL